jgi:hypothetical protein
MAGWNWGSALSGAGSGASLGGTVSGGNPLGIGIGLVGGAILGGLNGPQERKFSPYNLNQQYTDAQIQRLLGDRNYAQNEMNRYLANANRYGGEANQLANELVNISRPDAYDPNAVLVLVDNVKAGYLPKEFAPVVGKSLGSEKFDVPAMIVGGYFANGVQAPFGLRLFLAWGE